MAARWLAAALAVLVMGFAIQRGGTCTVAAVDEVLTEGRARRLLAMLEASLWVAGGLTLAQLGHLYSGLSGSSPAGVWSVAGGALLGLGAWINRACVFGAIARLGSGDWAYAATPLGFFFGCLTVMVLFHRPAPVLLGEPSLLLLAPEILAGLFVLFVLWRVRPGLASLRKREARRGAQIWSPHAATVMIGLSFLVTLVLVGRWAYTDVLADLARAMGGASGTLWLPGLLLVALYVGALLGGRMAGRWNSSWPAPSQLLRTFSGGVVMGWGSLLIPGSNDGLILIGIPLLRPYAWLAFASMCSTIAAAMLARRAWSAGAP